MEKNCTMRNAEGGPGCRIEKYPNVHVTLFNLSKVITMVHTAHALIVRAQLTPHNP
jgi:hypothetical protein